MTITTVQKKENSFVHLGNYAPQLRMPEIYTFDSRSEAVCAIILEQFVRGWETKRGETWQIALPFDKLADFKVDNNIIEFHPINLRHEFRDPRAYKRFRRNLDKTAPHLRAEFEESIKQEKANEYYYNRRMALNASPEFRRCELFHCENSLEFAKTVSLIVRAKFPVEQIYQEWEKCFRTL